MTIGNKIAVERFYQAKEKKMTLYKAYKQPSVEKVNIWDYWNMQFAEKYGCNNYEMYISTYNTFMFTITVKVHKIEQDYFFLITPTKHYTATVI